MRYKVKFTITKGGVSRQVEIDLSEVLKNFTGSETYPNCLKIEMKPEMEDHDFMEGKTSLAAEFYDDGVAFGMYSEAIAPGSSSNEVRSMILANCELPSKELNTPFVTSRLYAGDEETEIDSPVAIIVHPERDSEDDSRRVIYVDDTFAVARDWEGDVPNLKGTVHEWSKEDE